MPLAELLSHPKQVLDSSIPSGSSSALSRMPLSKPVDLVLICRQGNDSQLAASALLSATQNLEQIETTRKIVIRDVRGGLYGWQRDVDPQFPVY